MRHTPDRRIGSKVIWALVVLAMTVLVFPTESHALGKNTYTPVGLPQYLLEKTSIALDVSGPDPVCSMSISGVENVNTKDSGAPWEFILDPSELSSQPTIEVYLCEGRYEYVRLSTILPWSISSPIRSRDFPEEMGLLKSSISSASDEDGLVKIFAPGGRQVGSGVVPAKGSARIAFKGVSSKPLADYRIQITGATSGIVGNYIQRVAFRWTVLNDWAPTFARCSLVTWFYDPTGAPSSASPSAVRSDISGALKRLSLLTGLRFVETGSSSSLPKTNRLVFDWSYRGSTRVAGTGGFTSDDEGVVGRVKLNKRNWWASSDAYRGFGLVKSPRLVPGRGWLMVHEVMHTLGLGHTPSTAEIMYETSRRQITFGPGDKAGLTYLYQPKSCN